LCQNSVDVFVNYSVEDAPNELAIFLRVELDKGQQVTAPADLGLFDQGSTIHRDLSIVPNHARASFYDQASKERTREDVSLTGECLVDNEADEVLRTAPFRVCGSALAFSPYCMVKPA